MKRLTKNPWRLGWIFLTNGAVVLLFLSGPLRVHHDQLVLYQAMRTVSPAFSYLHELISDPWVPVLLVTLLAGILTEVRRTVLSPIFNLSPYVVWLILSLWSRVEAASEATPYELSLGILLMTPIVVIIAIDLVFYIVAFRRKRTEDLNVLSRV